MSTTTRATAQTSSGGIGLGGAVFILFLALKLGVGHTQVEHWSWWWVTSPLWIPFVLILGFIIVGFTFALIGAVFLAIFDRNGVKRRQRQRAELRNQINRRGRY